jgi:O-antigen biosynthesis protein
MEPVNDCRERQTGDVKFNPLKHPVCLDYPVWHEQSAWTEHIPFAMYLISALRPRVFVELGVFRGVSYCAFCQAVKKLNLGTRCHGVDSWRRDVQAGDVAEEELARLRGHHEPLYGSFSELMRSTFDDAAVSFSDGSIDLLHIDGFHSYDAVRKDFETWQPKLSNRAVVLFHDINVRQREFGAWKFWEEISVRFKSMSFLHGHGLGVLGVGSDLSGDVEEFLALDEAELPVARSFFREMGERIDAIGKYRAQNEEIARMSGSLRFMRALKLEGVRNIVRNALHRPGKKD